MCGGGMRCNIGTPSPFAANRKFFKSVNKESEAGAAVMTAWVTEPLLSRGSDLLTRRWVALVLWGKGPGVAMPSLLRARPSFYGETRSSRPPFQHPECAPRRPGAWSSRHRGRRWRSGGHEGQAVLTDESRVPSGGAAWAPPGAGATWWKA